MINYQYLPLYRKVVMVLKGGGGYKPLGLGIILDHQLGVYPPSFAAKFAANFAVRTQRMTLP